MRRVPYGSHCWKRLVRKEYQGVQGYKHALIFRFPFRVRFRYRPRFRCRSRSTGNPDRSLLFSSVFCCKATSLLHSKPRQVASAMAGSERPSAANIDRQKLQPNCMKCAQLGSGHTDDPRDGVCYPEPVCKACGALAPDQATPPRSSPLPLSPMPRGGGKGICGTARRPLDPGVLKEHRMILHYMARTRAIELEQAESAHEKATNAFEQVRTEEPMMKQTRCVPPGILVRVFEPK